MRATDGGGRTGEALVTVTVNRNLKSPNFNPTQYTKTVQDNEPLSSSIIQVKAKDDDVQVSVIDVSVSFVSVDQIKLYFYFSKRNLC